MDALFFDTSALVKRYYPEAGTDEVDDLIESDASTVITSLAVIETVSACRRKHNRGELNEREMYELLSGFFAEALDDFVVVPMDESLLSFSFELVLDDDLRTLDSIQLSAALSLDDGADKLRFVSADSELVSVATARGLESSNPIG